MAPVVSTNLFGKYDDIFSDRFTPPIILRYGKAKVDTADTAPDPPVPADPDCDPTTGRIARLGAKERPDVRGSPIQELQQDLEHIGYSVRPSRTAPLGVFDLHTARAVVAFQRHFFAGSRKQLRPPNRPPRQGGPALGRVDALTASWIASVRAELPS